MPKQPWSIGSKKKRRLMDSVLFEESVSFALRTSPPKSKFDVRTIGFKEQINFIEDPWRLKALFCTRRASKSYTGGLYMVQEAEHYESCNVLYLGLTRLSAKGIMWKDVLKDINKKNNLGMTFNSTELTATTRNGSIIYLTGADADEEEMEKLLGKKYRLVIIDEAASFTVDLRRLIYGILKPGTIDQGGSICLLGTSGNLTKGLFFDVTNRKEQGWKLFEWTAHQNPHVAKQWQEELDDIKINRPLFMETPLFKQWYLNQWVIDTEKLVYRFEYGRNEYDSLPTFRAGSWTYVLGVDLGYDDSSAFAVMLFHDHHKVLFIKSVHKEKEMDITDVANRIKWYQKEFGIHKVVIDGANKQAVEEMKKRHEISLTTADKTGKVDFIKIMNAEFIQANIKLSHECQDAKDEYLNLIWNERVLEKSGKREEHPNCENHLCDAILYGWRFCYQFLSKPLGPPVNLSNRAEYLEHTRKLLEESLQRQIDLQQAQDKGDEMFELAQMDVEENPATYFINKRKAQR